LPHIAPLAFGGENGWGVIGRQGFRVSRSSTPCRDQFAFLQNITSAIERRTEQVMHRDVDFARRHFRRLHVIAAAEKIFASAATY
jgi:hypothetical protein